MTTFSGFGYDCVALARVALAAMNVVANVTLGIVAVLAGRFVARVVMG